MRLSLMILGLGVLTGCGSVSNRSPDAPACQPECGAHATCEGTSCVCDTGFMGDGQTCTKIDECATDNGGCDANATCSNTASGRTCACNAGFLGDGMTCHEAFVRVAMLPGVRINPDGFGALAVGTGAKLFFGPRSNDPTQRYMRSFDVGTGAISEPLAFPSGSQTDFCACGLTSVLLSDGTTLYLLGNSGEKYNPTTNAWSAVASYTGNERGEAAGTYDAASNIFLLIGGRSNEGSAERMTLTGEAFAAEPGSLPVGMSSAAAVTPPGAPITYVAGGDLGMGVALVSHTTGSTGWTRLANAPENLSRPIGMGVFMGQIWVARNDGAFYFYNPMNDTWAASAIQAPKGTAVATMVAGQAFALVDTGSATEIYRLNAIQ